MQGGATPRGLERMTPSSSFIHEQFGYPLKGSESNWKLSLKRPWGGHAPWKKGIAHYMCRELIEDIYSECNIANSVIAEINKRSADKAMAVVKALAGDELVLRGLICQAVLANGWDDPCDEEYKKLMHLGEMLKK